MVAILIDDGVAIVLNIAASLLGPLELAIMECFWASGPQSSGAILATLRATRPIAHSTVTTTLARLVDQGLLTRALTPGHAMPWIYTARYPSRSALLVGTFEQLAAHITADPLDRA